MDKITSPSFTSQAATEAQNYVNLQGLDKLKQQAREDQREALKPVAEQFEALFVQQVLKESRKVSLDDGWLDGNQGDFYKDWHDKQLAQNLSAKGTLGFADKIVEQLAPALESQYKINGQSEPNKGQPTTPSENQKSRQVDEYMPTTTDFMAIKQIK